MSEYFISGAIKRPGALRRLARKLGAIKADGKINFVKLRRHYCAMTTRQKQQFNLYAHVLCKTCPHLGTVRCCGTRACPRLKKARGRHLR